MANKRNLIDESKLVYRQGNQVWHLHQGLKKHDEGDFIREMGEQYKKVGRVQTVAEGVVLAGAYITAYRSNEDGECVPKMARESLEKKEAERKAVEEKKRAEQEALDAERKALEARFKFNGA